MPGTFEEKSKRALDGLVNLIRDGKYSSQFISITILDNEGLDKLVCALREQPAIAAKIKSLAIDGGIPIPGANGEQVQEYTKGSISLFPNLNILRNLKSLNITHTNITQIPAGCLVECKKLDSIDLSSNRITSILPDVFQYTPKLRKFKITDNAIRSIDHNLFQNCHLIESVDFDDNPLSEYDLTQVLANIKALNNLRNTPAIILNSISTIGNKYLGADTVVNSIEVSEQSARFSSSEEIDQYFGNMARYLLSGILYRLPADCNLACANEEQLSQINVLRDLWHMYDERKLTTNRDVANYIFANPKLKRLTSPYKHKEQYKNRIHLHEVVHDMLIIFASEFSKYNMQKQYLDFLDSFSKRLRRIERIYGHLEYYALQPGSIDYAFKEHDPHPGYGLFLCILDDLPNAVINKYMPMFEAMGFNQQVAPVTVTSPQNPNVELRFSQGEDLIPMITQASHQDFQNRSHRSASLRANAGPASTIKFTAEEYLQYAKFLIASNQHFDAFMYLSNYINSYFLSSTNKSYKIVIGLHMSLLLDCVFSCPDLLPKGLDYLDTLCEKSSFIKKERDNWSFSPFMPNHGLAFKSYKRQGFGILELAFSEHPYPDTKRLLEHCEKLGIEEAKLWLQRTKPSSNNNLVATALTSGRSPNGLEISKNNQYIVLREISADTIEVQNIDDGHIAPAPSVFFSIPVPTNPVREVTMNNGNEELNQLRKEIRENYVTRTEFDRQQYLSQMEINRRLDQLNSSTESFGTLITVLQRRVEKISEIEMVREALNYKKEYNALVFFNKVLQLIESESLVATLVNSGRFKLDYGSEGAAIDGVAWILNATSVPGSGIVSGMIKFGFELYQSAKAKFRGKRIAYLTGTSHDSKKLAIHIATALLNCNGDLISTLSELDAEELAAIYVRSAIKYITKFEANKREFVVQKLIYCILTGYETKLSEAQSIKFKNIIYELGSAVPNNSWLEVIMKEYANSDYANDSISASDNEQNMVAVTLSAEDANIYEKPTPQVMFSSRANAMFSRIATKAEHAVSALREQATKVRNRHMF